MYDKSQLSAEVKKFFGFDTFKGNQEDIIMNLLNETRSMPCAIIAKKTELHIS